MPRPYQYYPIENFPIPAKPHSTWETFSQLGLPEEKGDDSAHSTIKFEGYSPYLDYLKYHVHHETDKPTWLRYSRDERRRAIFIEEFHMFLPPNLSYMFIDTTVKSSRDLLKRIKQKDPNFQYKLREVDLLAMKETQSQHVRGGWFRELDIADVSTAAIFGDNVGESDEWEKYETKGKLSSLVIEFSYLGEHQSVIIGSSGAITLYSNYDESSSLKLVEKFNNIAMRFQTEIDPKSRKDSRKKV